MSESQITYNVISINSKSSRISASNLKRIISIISFNANGSIIKSYSNISSNSSENSEISPVSYYKNQLIIELPNMTIFEARRITQKVEKFLKESQGEFVKVTLMVATEQNFQKVKLEETSKNVCKDLEPRVSNPDEKFRLTSNNSKNNSEDIIEQVSLEGISNKDSKLKKLLNAKLFKFPNKPKKKQLRITMLFQNNFAQYAQKFKHDSENLRLTFIRRK